MATERKTDKGAGIEKLPNEKEKDIQLLKNKLKIPATQLIQGLELVEIEEEKEKLNNELLDCKAKLLKFADREKQWHEDMDLVVETEKNMKEKFEDMEKKLQDKEKELESRIIPTTAQSIEQSIVQLMSQVIIKGLELTRLRNQNKNLENLEVQREQERKTLEKKSQEWEAKCQELLTKNDKLTKQVTRQPSLQGSKHIIWDVLITEAANLRPYLD